LREKKIMRHNRKYFVLSIDVTPDSSRRAAFCGRRAGFEGGYAALLLSLFSQGATILSALRMEKRSGLC
jgi:hypothetical protein